MTVNIKGKPKQFATAETEVSNEGETVETQSEVESVQIPESIAAPNGAALDAEVEFGLQSIIPTGDYQNIRVIVGIKCRCEADSDIIDATFNICKDWVDEKITSVIAEITNPPTPEINE